MASLQPYSALILDPGYSQRLDALLERPPDRAVKSVVDRRLLQAIALYPNIYVSPLPRNVGSGRHGLVTVHDVPDLYVIEMQQRLIKASEELSPRDAVLHSTLNTGAPWDDEELAEVEQRLDHEVYRDALESQLRLIAPLCRASMTHQRLDGVRLPLEEFSKPMRWGSYDAETVFDVIRLEGWGWLDAANHGDDCEVADWELEQIADVTDLDALGDIAETLGLPLSAHSNLERARERLVYALVRERRRELAERCLRRDFIGQAILLKPLCSFSSDHDFPVCLVGVLRHCRGQGCRTHPTTHTSQLFQ